MEEILKGGNMSVVVRSDDTVRRSAGPWTDSVHTLLAGLRAAGIDWVPEPRGLDERGREIVSFVEGVVPAYPMPAWVWSAAILVECGHRLREMHDASAALLSEAGNGLALGTIWQLPAHEPVEVVCHNDFAPYNLAFVDGHFAGAIDFDTASPGPRIWDLAYLAYRLVPLTGPEHTDDTAPPNAEHAHRLSILIAAYGMSFTAAQLKEALVLRLEELAAFSEERALSLAKPELAEHAAWYRADAARLASEH